MFKKISVFVKRLAAALALLIVVCALILVGAAYWFDRAVPETVAEAQAVEETTQKTEAPPEVRPPNFPHAVDGSIKFEDALHTGVDQGASFRTFEIPVAPGDTRYLTAIYLDEPEWKDWRNDDAFMITRFADLNAAFSTDVAVDLPPVGGWERIRVQIGGFSQDYCGDVEAELSLRSSRIFAVANIHDGEIKFPAEQCPLRLEDYRANKTKFGTRSEPDDFSAFCAVRRECLQAYYAKPENQEPLRLQWLEKVANLRLQ